MAKVVFNDIDKCPKCGHENWQDGVEETFHDLMKGEDGMLWNECPYCGAVIYENGDYK